MKVLLTGANGFLGRHIRHGLTEAGWTVCSLGTGETNDICADLAAGPPKLPGAGFDMVVHAAGKAHSIPGNSHEAEAFFRVNREGTIHLCRGLESCSRLPTSFVFISTVAVYGLQEGEGIREDQPLSGNTPYARSKIEAEEWMQQWCGAKNIRLYILRLPLVAGTQAPGNLGAMVQAIRQGRYFNLGEGSARKSIVLADSVAELIPRLNEGPGGVFHLTDGVHPTFAQLASHIAHHCGKPDPRSIPMWLALPVAMAGNLLGNKAPLDCDKLRKISATLTFDDLKAQEVLGWNPVPVLQGYLP